MERKTIIEKDLDGKRNLSTLSSLVAIPRLVKIVNRLHIINENQNWILK